jgi:DNA repair photolyase
VPSRRLAAVETLARAGVPVNVMVAPIIPGLTDEEMPAILRAARTAGAQTAAYIIVRLPFAVKDLFETWLEQHVPERKNKILNRIRSLRDGQLYRAKWGIRMRGAGIFADQIEALFDATCRKLGFSEERRSLSTEHFRRPPAAQLELL